MRRILITALVLGLALHSAAHALDEAQERRVRSGLRLFRVTLAADEDIASKVTGGRMVLLVVYAQDRKLADDFAEELRGLGKGEDRGVLRGVPLEVRVTNDLTPDSLAAHRPAGLVVVEDLSDDGIGQLARFGIQNKVIVYSPFEGDVDRGVLAGLAIETRVRPYINIRTLRDSGIRIKEFFLKVAKTTEPAERGG